MNQNTLSNTNTMIFYDSGLVLVFFFISKTVNIKNKNNILQEK
jgi:hypothetical protein